MKSAFHSDLGNGHFACLKQVTGRADLDGVEVGDQGDPKLLGKESAKIEFGNKKLIGNLVYGTDLSIIIVDVLYNAVDALIQAMLLHVVILRISNGGEKHREAKGNSVKGCLLHVGGAVVGVQHRGEQTVQKGLVLFSGTENGWLGVAEQRVKRFGGEIAKEKSQNASGYGSLPYRRCGEGYWVGSAKDPHQRS